MELADFLRNSDDPMLTSILEQDYPVSTAYRRYRNENAQRAKEDAELYPNYICMEKFVKENFKTKLLALQHNHVSRPYYIELLKLIMANLGLADFTIKNEFIAVPGEGHTHINPNEFLFFRRYFPDLESFKIENKPALGYKIRQFLVNKQPSPA
jgi:hypothetical protein